jgi:hypothetical protein
VNLVRVAVFAAAALLLAGGYLASQAAFLASLDPQARSATADYAKAIDSPAVKLIALAIFLACVVFTALPQKEEQA